MKTKELTHRTLAVIRALGVPAEMRTASVVLETLVGVLADLAIESQPKSHWTAAPDADGDIEARVRASSVLDAALLDRSARARIIRQDVTVGTDALPRAQGVETVVRTIRDTRVALVYIYADSLIPRELQAGWTGALVTAFGVRADV